MQLSRKVPARTKTIKFNWCNKDFTKMSPSFRRIRSGRRYEGFNCYWCKHEFIDGESMGLGSVIGKGNKMFCHDCCDKANEKKEEG